MRNRPRTKKYDEPSERVDRQVNVNIDGHALQRMMADSALRDAICNPV